MTGICGKFIVAGLAKSFGIALPADFSNLTLNTEEIKWRDRVSLMIRCAETGEMFLRDRQELMRDDFEDEHGDPDWDYEDEVVEKKKEVVLTKKMLDEAIVFYRSSKRKRNRQGQGVRSLQAMSKRFRWITNQNMLDQVVKYEKTGEVPIRRNVQLEKLAHELDREVEAVIDEGIQFSDFELREMAMSINRQQKLWPRFKCSDSWILKWKKKFRVSSRRVTEFVSVKTQKDSKKTLELLDQLHKEVEVIVSQNPGIAIWNCDQTGIVKESHGMRTLARTGTKKVKARVQSKNATSHSISYMPVIGSDGYQKKKVFIQLGEPKGQLPQKGCYRDNRMVLAVEKSHIMSKSMESAGNFFKNALFSGPLPKKLLLILDSWPIFRDHNFIRSFAPSNLELFIVNIPPGATSICQPCDLSYNHQLKGIQKRLTTIVLFRGIDYKLSQRDNLLKFATQAHWILGSDRFKGFISYGFFKGGFINTKPPPFDGPKQFIFGPGSFDPCPCSQQGCTLCPRCEVSYCFECFWVECHRC